MTARTATESEQRADRHLRPIGRSDAKDRLSFEKRELGFHGRRHGFEQDCRNRSDASTWFVHGEGWSDAAGGLRRRSGLAARQTATRAVAGRPGKVRYVGEA